MEMLEAKDWHMSTLRLASFFVEKGTMRQANIPRRIRIAL